MLLGIFEGAITYMFWCSGERCELKIGIGMPFTYGWNLRVDI